jgi:two-component system, NtrC family, sensor kinase
VRERTHELEERNLAVKEAQEALLRSTRLAAVGEVAGMAAHEVLNPLTSVISRVSDLKERVTAVKETETKFLLDLQSSWEKDFTDGGFAKLVKNWQEPSKLLEGSSLWDEDLKNLKSVGEGLRNDFDTLIKDADFLLQESQRISRIVNSFRSLSSVKADVKPHDVNDLLDKSIEIMTDLAVKHKISLEKKYTAIPCLVLVDEDEIIQVMTNLLRNSIQAINEKTDGERHIEVSTTVDAAQLSIRIKDTGMGITDTDKKKLFVQKFTTKNKDEGTGIGLSLSRRLIRAFKGDIVLEQSARGKGTVFAIRLPAIISQQEGRSA